MTKASIEQDFRLIINKFGIIVDEVAEEVTLVDELVFLEKSWYLCKEGNSGQAGKSQFEASIRPNNSFKNDDEIKEGKSWIRSHSM